MNMTQEQVDQVTKLVKRSLIEALQSQECCRDKTDEDPNGLWLSQEDGLNVHVWGNGPDPKHGQIVVEVFNPFDFKRWTKMVFQVNVTLEFSTNMKDE